MAEQQRRPFEGDMSEIGAEERRLKEARQSKVEGFRLSLDLDDEFGEISPAPVVTEEEPVTTPAEEQPPVEEERSEKKPYGEAVRIDDEPDIPEAPAPRRASHTKSGSTKSKQTRQAMGCAGGILYVFGVLAISGILAFFILNGALDMLGINKTDDLVDIEIPAGASTEEVAQLLQDHGLISQPLVFRLYSRFAHADGTYQPGIFTLYGSLGYKGIIEELQAASERSTVDITFPEGLTVLQVAQRLEDYGVCKRDEFLWTLNNADFSDYDFVKAAPTCGDGGDRPYRIYRLEGYLFPDTYTFYENSSPETAARKFFDNFEVRVTSQMRAAIKAKGISLDDAIIMASLLQQEANNKLDMTNVSRVLWNRLNSDELWHLQLDSTELYTDNFFEDLSNDSPIYRAYDTYICTGLPTGAICNPGLDALNAVITPSTATNIINCYYFATDLSVTPSKTYYSETFEEHMAICNFYGIGVHG